MGYLFGSPHNKDYSIFGSILGSPYLGQLPYRVVTWGLGLQNPPLILGILMSMNSTCFSKFGALRELFRVWGFQFRYDPGTKPAR